MFVFTPRRLLGYNHETGYYWSPTEISHRGFDDIIMTSKFKMNLVNFHLLMEKSGFVLKQKLASDLPTSQNFTLSGSKMVSYEQLVVESIIVIFSQRTNCRNVVKSFFGKYCCMVHAASNRINFTRFESH